MKVNKTNIVSLLSLLSLVFLGIATTSCGDEEIDNAFSRNESIIKIVASSDYVVLDESHPNDVALTISWNSAKDHGYDYMVTYQYQSEVIESKANAIKEYEDEGNFTRSYTNAQLQELLIEHFGQKTSTVGTMRFTMTATFAGPRTIVPDISAVSVKVKTYGPKQFAADRLYMSGSAVGQDRVELECASEGIYRYTGNLSEGTIYFPIDYADENNALVPASKQETTLSNEEMNAVIVDLQDAYGWNIPSETTYRITVNLNNHTVKIVAAGAVIDIDRLFMCGSAVGETDIEVPATLENDLLFAWRGELKAGQLWLPIEFEEQKAISIVPKDSQDHSINDATTTDFAMAANSGKPSAYWEIPADDTYRIVVDIENRNIAIYSSANDLKNTVVSYNNTSLGINPFQQEVTRLWMYGTFNAFAHDSGLFSGFQEKYSLTQSLANPQVFVYKGDVLPRETASLQYKLQDGTATAAGAVVFFVDNFNNNMWAYGSTAPAKRNSYSGLTQPELGVAEGVVAGQSDNRYAYFAIPVGCNYVEINIETLQIVFDAK